MRVRRNGVAIPLVAVTLALAAGNGFASTDVPLSPGVAPPAAPVMTTEDLTSFFDGLIPYGLAYGDIAGGVVAVVKDGKIVFAKGYGYANVARREPVIANQTLFRAGSISKLFTWTAVMQLVQAHKIDLDEDINAYLDFRIPDEYGTPITMRNLMTHTAGFENLSSDIFVRTAGELVPLRANLMAEMPKRIFPPGKVVAYSNYGAALAGYIVQRVSGEPFAAYVADHIFKPLGMLNSTFVQPLPPSLAGSMAAGYVTASGRPEPFEILEIAPAGALTTSATDMAHFMLAHLEGGSYDGTSILSPAMTGLMHSTQSRMAPGIDGFALGFWEQNRNGLRIIGHGGDTRFFHSLMSLIPQQHVGIFVSFNSPGKRAEALKLRVAVVHAFLDRYFPNVPAAQAAVPGARTDAARVAGWYEGSRRRQSALRFLGAIHQTRVIALPDGTIQTGTNLDGSPTRWREVGPLEYRKVGGQSELRFVTGTEGRIAYWVSDDLPIEIFQPVSGMRRYSMLKWCGGLSLIVWSLTSLSWFGGRALRRYYGKPLAMGGLPAGLRIASRLGARALLLTMAGWLLIPIALVPGSAHPQMWLTGLYVLSAAALLGAFAIIAAAILRVLRGPGSWLLARPGEALLGLTAVYAAWVLVSYGMVSFNYLY